MYDAYASEAIAMMNVDDATATALQSLLGDCSLPLSHRAPVTIEGEPTSSQNVQNISVNDFLQNIVNQIDNHTDEYYSLLNVNNQLSVREGDTVINNFSVYSPGVSFFQDLLTTNLEASTITIAGTTYCWVEKTFLTDATLEYSFDSATCSLTLTLTLTDDTIRGLDDCP